MEEIDLFDRYIKDELSEKEQNDFNERLKSDKDFLDEFKIYLFTVKGICQEAEQENLEFGHALKSISKDELLEIVGEKSDYVSEKSGKSFRIKNWMWQLGGAAAVIGLAFFYVAEMERTARHNADNAIYYGIYAYNDGNSFSRGAGITQQVISSMSDKELESKLSDILRQYETSADDEEIVSNGTLLVMAYVKLHDRQKAINLLNELISKYNGNEYFEDDVNNWTTILTLLEQ